MDMPKLTAAQRTAMHALVRAEQGFAAPSAEYQPKSGRSSINWRRPGAARAAYSTSSMRLPTRSSEA